MDPYFLVYDYFNLKEIGCGVEDDSWKVGTEAAANWYENQYDDRSGKEANAIGIYGCKPWGRQVKTIP